MSESILRIATDLVMKICQRAESGEIRDLDIMAESVLNDCKDASIQVIAEIIQHMNEGFRGDKPNRRSMGLVIKEKDRPRSILTALGQVNYNRDYFYDKNLGQYAYILDQALGVEKYERIGAAIGAELVSRATEVSYAKSAEIVTGGAVSRQSVRNHILKMRTPEIETNGKKRIVEELHIFADEDHAHMQKPEKKKGKQSKIIPLVTVTEGVKQESKNRNRTIEATHLSDEDFDTKKLWKSVEGYLSKQYELHSLKRIYLHGDGGVWIKGGLENFPQTVRVMDGFHFHKELRKVSRLLPQRNVRIALLNAIRYDDRRRADEYLQSLLEEDLSDKDAEKIRKFAVYLLGNWKEIRLRIIDENLPGSCTEGLVSQVLSKRFSRDPLGWGEKALGKLVMARLYRKNGGRIKKDHFREKDDRQERYSEYADRLIDEHIKGAVDFSIFESEMPIFNGASGTQINIHGIGMMRNTLIN